MNLLIIGLILLLIISLWDRFRSEDGIQEWMLNTAGLDGLCSDYLDYVDQMSSGQHDASSLQYLDSQRQVTHNQILERLDLDRSAPIDMVEFCKRYLGKT